LAAFFGEAAFFVAAFGFAAFFAAAGFFVAVDLGFLGVVAFLALGFAAFFVAVFFTPVDFVAPTFFAFVSLGFLVFAALATFGFELDRALTAFFGLAAVVAAADVVDADVVAEVLAAVATFLAGLAPADLERARFFVPAAAVDVEAAFFGLVDFFFAGLASVVLANLNEPLAPLPLVCLNVFAFTPFFSANLRCWLAERGSSE